MKREDYLENKVVKSFYGNVVGFIMPAGGSVLDFCKEVSNPNELTDEEIDTLAKIISKANGIAMEDRDTEFGPDDEDRFKIIVPQELKHYFIQFFNMSSVTTYTSLDMVRCSVERVPLHYPIEETAKKIILSGNIINPSGEAGGATSNIFIKTIASYSIERFALGKALVIYFKHSNACIRVIKQPDNELQNLYNFIDHVVSSVND